MVKVLPTYRRDQVGTVRRVEIGSIQIGARDELVVNLRLKFRSESRFKLRISFNLDVLICPWGIIP